MRKFQLLAVAVLMLSMVTPTQAQSDLSYRMSFDGSYTNRYFDEQKIGTIASGGAQYYLDAGGNRVLALEYFKNRNEIPRSAGVELGKESFGFGAYLPTSPVKLKMAGSWNQYMLGDDYWALGLYPQLDRGRSALNATFERDADATLLTSGRVSTRWQEWSGSFGASHEHIRGHGSEQRCGLEVARQFEPAGIMTIAGAAVNRDEAPTWMAGLAHPASTDSGSGINPGLLGIVRQKPESFSITALATLWGTTLSAGTCQGIGESIFNGSLSRTRVVRNRDFNTVGVGGGYDLMDFGLVVASFSYGDVDAGPGIHARSSNISLYGTLPTRFSLFGLPIDNPFLGLESQTITDLAVDPATGVLDDFGQGWKSLAFGGKLRLNANADESPGKQAGYLRLQTVLRFAERFDGAYMAATFWH